MANPDMGNPHNTLWYRIDNGYALRRHSACANKLSKTDFILPEKGQLGEITVPYCDTKKDPYTYAERGYRIYYGSTHWVKRVIVQRDEKASGTRSMISFSSDRITSPRTTCGWCRMMS